MSSLNPLPMWWSADLHSSVKVCTTEEICQQTSHKLRTDFHNFQNFLFCAGLHSGGLHNSLGSIISSDDKTLYFIKKNPPIVCGEGGGE